MLLLLSDLLLCCCYAALTVSWYHISHITYLIVIYIENEVVLFVLHFVLYGHIYELYHVDVITAGNYFMISSYTMIYAYLYILSYNVCHRVYIIHAGLDEIGFLVLNLLIIVVVFVVFRYLY